MSPLPLRCRPAAFFVAAALSLTPSSTALGQGLVFVVDDSGGPGVDFTDLQTAVNTVSSGDLLLVRPGTYGPVTISAKAVSIVAEDPAAGTVWIEGVTVSNLTGATDVVLRGLHLEPTASQGLPPLLVQDVLTGVLVEDCDLLRSETAAGVSVPAVDVADSSGVVVTRSILFGEPGQHGSTGGAGAHLAGGYLALFDCDVRGGDGKDAVAATNKSSSKGGAGVWLEHGQPKTPTFESVLFLHGGVVSGGRGGNGAALGTHTPPCLPPAGGGDGVEGPGQVTVLDCVVTGGAAGTGGGPVCVQAVPGLPFDVQGSVKTWNELRRGLLASSPASVGSSTTLQFEGAPGETVLLLLSADALIYDAPVPNAVPGPLVPASPILTTLGTVPASGLLSVALPVSVNLPAAIDQVGVFLQALVPGSWGHGLLSSPTTIHVVR